MDSNITVVAVGVAGFLLGAILAFVLGRSEGRSAGRREGRDASENTIRAFARGLARGELPETQADSAEGELAEVLRDQWTLKGAEREAALVQAIARVSGYLETQVKDLLSKAASSSSVGELRGAISAVLGNLADVKSFLRKPKPAGATHDLVSTVQQVAREFAADQGVRLRMQRGSGTIKAKVDPDSLMDALYLIFHNAARFGDAPVIDVSVETSGDRARISVTDRGSGFTSEAKKRAFDPFYSTAPDGLGLGLPHARKLVDAMGGQIELSNVPEGGGRVTVSFPSG